MSDKKKVLISGAGITGLATHIALDKEKFNIDTIEKRDSLNRLGYALIFMPLGVQALKHIGCRQEEIARIGRTVEKNRVRDSDGNLKQVTDYRPLIEEFGDYMMVTRRRLYRLLESKAKIPNIEFSESIDSISDMDSETPLVTFKGNKQEKRYDIIIGTDGVYSSVRNILFPDAKLEPLGFSVFWSWIPRESGVYPKPGMVGTAKAGVGFFNSSEKDKCCVAFFVDTDSVPSDLSPDEYAKFLRGHTGHLADPVPVILDNLPSGEEIYLQKDYELSLNEWSLGHVVIAGDAAHKRSMFSGAGAALGLEDGLILGRYLNSEDLSVKEAITKYQDMQKPRAKKCAMSELSLYLQDQQGVVDYLSELFSSSLLYSDDFSINSNK